MVKRRFHLIVYHLLFFLVIAVSSAGEDNDYIVIKLDQFPETVNSGNTGLSTAVPGQAKVKAAQVTAPLMPGIYPAGKPLQVVKSYIPGYNDAADDISRSIVQTTGRYVPQVLTGMRNSFSSAEYIDRLFMNISYPVSDHFSAGFEVYGAIFDLVDNGDDPAISTGLVQFALEGKYSFSPEISLYGAVIIGGTHSVWSPGLEGRINYVNRGGIELSLGGHLWTPWAENTIGVYNNGRRSGLDMAAVLPLCSSVDLNIGGGVDWRFTAEDVFKTNTFEGTDLSGGARLNWDFFKREYRQLPIEFLAADYLSMDNVSSRIGLFASVQASKYFRRNDGDALVPVVDASIDQRFGLSAAYAFTSHLAATAQMYVGFDPARDISFGKLYGFDTRIVYIPAPRLRLYGEFTMDSEAPTGITEGKTWYYGVGMNYRF